MTVVRWENDLPKQIQKHLRDLRDEADARLQLAVKTGYRANPDMPYAWLVLATHHLLICNTHRTRGVVACLRYREISSIRSVGDNAIEILPRNLEHGDLTIPLPDVDADTFQEIIKTARGHIDDRVGD